MEICISVNLRMERNRVMLSLSMLKLKLNVMVSGEMIRESSGLVVQRLLTPNNHQSRDCHMLHNYIQQIEKSLN